MFYSLKHMYIYLYYSVHNSLSVSGFSISSYMLTFLLPLLHYADDAQLFCYSHQATSLVAVYLKIEKRIRHIKLALSKSALIGRSATFWVQHICSILLLCLVFSGNLAIMTDEQLTFSEHVTYSCCIAILYNTRETTSLFFQHLWCPTSK